MAVRLIPVRAHATGRPSERLSIWVNPEHIVTAMPKFTGDSPNIDLNVELKLVGMSLFDVFIGRYLDRDAAEAAWDALLGDFQA